jgi:hypothetical protein
MNTITPTSRLAFIPGMPTDAAELKDTTPDPVQDVKLSPRQQKAIDNLLLPDVSDKGRQRCYQILQVFPAGLLENLAANGLTIHVTQQGTTQNMGGGKVMLGGYAPLQRQIAFDEPVLMHRAGRHVLTHEMIHAIDHMRAERVLGQQPRPVLASTRDAEVKALYSNYMARGVVESIEQFRYNLKATQPDNQLPTQAQAAISDNWGTMQVDYERKDGKEIFHVEQQPVRRMGPMEEIEREENGVPGVTRDLPHTTVDVPMLRRQSAHVEQDGTASTITVPEGGISYTGDVWSDYAHRSGQVEEYTAEAFSFYLESPDSREKLEMADPDMFAYTKKVLDEEFNLRP